MSLRLEMLDLAKNVKKQLDINVFLLILNGLGYEKSTQMVKIHQEITLDTEFPY